MDTLLYGAGLVVMGNTAECLVLDHQIRPVAAMAYRSARTAYWTTKSGPLRPWLTGQPGRRIGPPNQARCGHGLQVSQDGANSSDQVPQLAPLRNRLAREGAMLVAAVLSSFRCSAALRPAVHPAPLLTFHGRGRTRAPRPGPGPATGCQAQTQRFLGGRLHGVGFPFHSDPLVSTLDTLVARCRDRRDFRGLVPAGISPATIARPPSETLTCW